MTGKHLHIISFDIPLPADYGGVIDVFYQIKALSSAGVKIHLHCFVYGDRKPRKELEKYCVEVNYYKRKTGLPSFFSGIPYIIKSRISEELKQNLLKDDYPVLCQGFHSCGILLDKRFEKRKIFLRAANVEHDYYAALAKTEKNIFKKYYYKTESRKLLKFGWLQGESNVIFAVSESDSDYFIKRFPEVKVIRVYGFNEAEEIEINEGRGDFVLFHGNLSVRENIDAALFIIDKIAAATKHEFLIAGKNPDRAILRAAGKLNNVKVVSNPTYEKMHELMERAQIHLMLTFQPTGFKLKLLMSLFRGRHVIANEAMIQGTGLEGCVVKAETSQEIISQIERLFPIPVSTKDIMNRKQCISSEYLNSGKAEKMIKAMF